MYMYAFCMGRHLGHLDADCFYVSCERVRHRFLQGQSVGVLSNQGACVIAKSYEMKARGVTTGMPIWDALPLCPEGIFIKRDFEWYEVLSRRILDIVRSFSPAVEYYSIDEMFFDAQTMSPDDAKALQQRLLSQTAVPVSVGVAASKILAKLASSSGKPFGCVYAVEEAVVRRLLRDRPVDKITGVGRRSRSKLERYGIHTCEDFARADRRLIRRLLTKRGEDLWWELNGTPVLPLNTTRTTPKNLSRGGSLGMATADPERLTGWVARNAERLVEALDYHCVYCEQLAMSLEFKDGGCAAQQTSLAAATADFRSLYPAGLRLLAACWPSGRVVSYMHLIAGKLTARQYAQRSLFEESDPRQQVIDRVKRLINQRLGRFAIRSGATLPLDDIYRDVTNSYDICDVYGKTCF
jgi:nucleotidyltransferase/DNA polymerase involved in DNA repair